MDTAIDISAPDRLGTLFKLQNELSARVSLSFEQFQALSEPERVEWVEKYLKALHNEIEEVRGTLAWKWWKKNQTNDWEKAREESIDVLFFALNLCLVVGFPPNANALFEAYLKKSKINHQRQDNHY